MAPGNDDDDGKGCAWTRITKRKRAAERDVVTCVCVCACGGVCVECQCCDAVRVVL